MNVDTGIWEKLTKVVLFLVGVAVLLLIAIWYLPLIKQNERMRKEIIRLDSQLQMEAAQKRETQNTIETLQNDPKAVERLARETFGYAKPGETVVRFEPAPTNQPSAR
ncbi:MAG TPA: septum formation initiator family protein [Verrucomicrobiota bacterium]|nr:septum formation initiator family protein [Verrucomicrobiota bacterium]